jgi:hypothetical protein
MPNTIAFQIPHYQPKTKILGKSYEIVQTSGMNICNVIDNLRNESLLNQLQTTWKIIGTLIKPISSLLWATYVFSSKLMLLVWYAAKTVMWTMEEIKHFRCQWVFTENKTWAVHLIRHQCWNPFCQCEVKVKVTVKRWQDCVGEYI